MPVLSASRQKPNPGAEASKESTCRSLDRRRKAHRRPQMTLASLSPSALFWVNSAAMAREGRGGGEVSECCNGFATCHPSSPPRANRTMGNGRRRRRREKTRTKVALVYRGKQRRLLHSRSSGCGHYLGIYILFESNING